MLYAILRPIMRTAFRIYFGGIARRGLDAIEQGGPMLILANHTNSFMDAMLLAACLKRRIHFFARGDAFRRPWADRLLRSLGLLPVYRLQEGKALMSRNEESNEEAMRILQQGGAVLIFAEGASHVAKVLKPLKKGPFRLAVRAAAVLGASFRILPLGISFGKPEVPGTDAWLIAGAPLAVVPPADDSESAAAKAALQCLRETAVRLAPLVPDAGAMDKAAAADLLVAMQREARGAILPFEQLHRTAALVRASDPADADGLLALAERYTTLRNALAVTEPAFSPVPTSRLILTVLLLSPAGVPGWLLHLVPLAAARALTRHYVRETDFIAPVFVPVALVLTLGWYLLLLLPLALVLLGAAAPLGLALAAGCGLIAGKGMVPALRRLAARLHADSVAPRYASHWAQLLELRRRLLSASGR